MNRSYPEAHSSFLLSNCASYFSIFNITSNPDPDRSCSTSFTIYHFMYAIILLTNNVLVRFLELFIELVKITF
jgi:hypothetical protein